MTTILKQLQFSPQQIEFRKKILILTLLTFAALC